MAGLAVPLGGLLKSMPPLRAYTWDIAGSMAGIAAFTVLSGLGTGPIAWFLVLGVLLLLGGLAAGHPTGIARHWRDVRGDPRRPRRRLEQGQIWSPYYRIDQYDSGGITAIDVNGIPHQAMWPLDEALRQPMYGQVYDWFPDRTFDNVLIVGRVRAPMSRSPWRRARSTSTPWRSTRRSRRSGSRRTRSIRTTTRG